MKKYAVKFLRNFHVRREKNTNSDVEEKNSHQLFYHNEFQILPQIKLPNRLEAVYIYINDGNQNCFLCKIESLLKETEQRINDNL